LDNRVYQNRPQIQPFQTGRRRLHPTCKKSKKDFNADTQKSFIHKTGAIFSGIWEKPGTAYIWEKGKFKSVITGD
jgi:hypothetical protein